MAVVCFLTHLSGRRHFVRNSKPVPSACDLAQSKSNETVWCEEAIYIFQAIRYKDPQRKGKHHVTRFIGGFLCLFRFLCKSLTNLEHELFGRSSLFMSGGNGLLLSERLESRPA
jgi:hypothetical protein